MADLVQTAASVAHARGRTKTTTWGETITAGMSVYRKTTDRRWYKAKNNGTAEEAGGGTELAVALSGGANGQKGLVQLGGEINLGAALTVGKTYAVSNTAGAICPVEDVDAGKRTAVLGVAETASNLVLTPCHPGVAAA